jgi:RecB family exonuclease
MANQGSSESGFHFLSSFQRCQKYFQWKYLLQLEPKYPSTKLLYGRAIHKGLEAWYKVLATKGTAPTRVKAALEAFKQEMTDCRPEYMYQDTYEEDVLRGIEAFQTYGIQYAYERWEVIGQPEQELECVLPNGMRLTGRIDLVVKSPEGVIYIVDHKTTGWALASLTQTLQVSDQSNAYLLLWNRNFQGMKTTSVIYNVIRQYKAPECKQILVMKTEADVERFAADAASILDEIATKVTQSAAVWRMNTDSCFLYNRPCPYLTLCKGTAWQTAIGVEYKKREPRPEDDVE